MSSVLVIGEALVDVVHSGDGGIKNVPGGSPANTAVALARLGITTFMKARISKDKFGSEIRSYLENQNVNLNLSLFVDEPSSVIDAFIQKDGSAKYEANLKGASDYGWTKSELDIALAENIKIIQLGSLTSYIEPGASNVENWYKQLRNNSKHLLTFDPNIRHPLDAQPEDEVRKRAKNLASLAHVVKASDEDLSWISPDQDVIETAKNFIENGTTLVVITLGKNGAVAINSYFEVIQIPAPVVKVKDTIGAGDTFAAALIAQLLEKQIVDEKALSALPLSDLRDILSNCAMTSALTCSRQGANPPYRHEVTW
jgi:fructokinase